MFVNEITANTKGRIMRTTVDKTAACGILIYIGIVIAVSIIAPPVLATLLVTFVALVFIGAVGGILKEEPVVLSMLVYVAMVVVAFASIPTIGATAALGLLMLTGLVVVSFSLLVEM